jgi:hypothetical protein
LRQHSWQPTDLSTEMMSATVAVAGKAASKWGHHQVAIVVGQRDDAVNRR